MYKANHVSRMKLNAVNNVFEKSQFSRDFWTVSKDFFEFFLETRLVRGVSLFFSFDVRVPVGVAVGNAEKRIENITLIETTNEK